MNTPFHLAIPVKDIEATRTFYTEMLGCAVGREAECWIDFNFFGHQLSVHIKPEALESTPTNSVDAESVPVRHFGLVLKWDAWHKLVECLDKKAVSFLIKPTIRFEGKVGEQATFFIVDPSGNAKSFKDSDQLFATR